MPDILDHAKIDAALRRAGASWDAAQSHGLLTSRLAVAGVDGGLDWLRQVLVDTDPANALAAECSETLNELYEFTHRQLDERQSAFQLLLPDDEHGPAERATALAHWCEGFLHGLVSAPHGDDLKERLAAEPLADIIKDLLQMTRAAFDDDDDLEESEQAYSELVEYARVAAQLAYEELAEIRERGGNNPSTVH